MIDAAATPPEINSTLMWGSPAGTVGLVAGSTGYTASATAHTAAAAALATTSAAMAGVWVGVAGEAFTASLSPIIADLGAHAASAAARTATLAALAATVDAGIAQTPHPGLVFGNRADLATLSGADFFGVNSPAIATNQGVYADLWAQAAGGRLGADAGAKATAAGLPELPATIGAVNPAGLAAGTAAAAAAGGKVFANGAGGIDNAGNDVALVGTQAVSVAGGAAPIPFTITNAVSHGGGAAASAGAGTAAGAGQAAETAETAGQQARGAISDTDNDVLQAFTRNGLDDQTMNSFTQIATQFPGALSQAFGGLAGGSGDGGGQNPLTSLLSPLMSMASSGLTGQSSAGAAPVLDTASTPAAATFAAAGSGGVIPTSTAGSAGLIDTAAPPGLSGGIRLPPGTSAAAPAARPGAAITPIPPMFSTGKHQKRRAAGKQSPSPNRAG